MFRTTLRSSALRASSSALRVAPAAPRRFASTTARAAESKGTWRGTVVRWSLAFGAVYWYNTSSLFADEFEPQTRPAPISLSDADLPTVEAVIEHKRRQLAEKAATAAPPNMTEESNAAQPGPPREESATAGAAAAEEEEDHSQQAAFNPETGEINWDCPCLGGMAHGPCGEEFKAAFSCFVYSKEEPKGMDCIEKFAGMQDCFRAHPDVYAAELADDADNESDAPDAASPPPSTPAENMDRADATSEKPPAMSDDLKGQQGALVPGEKDIPKPAFDATDANEKTGSS